MVDMGQGKFISIITDVWATRWKNNLNWSEILPTGKSFSSPIIIYSFTDFLWYSSVGYVTQTYGLSISAGECYKWGDLLLLMGKQRVRPRSDVSSGQMRNLDNVNITKPLINPAKVLPLMCETFQMILIHKQPSGWDFLSAWLQAGGLVGGAAAVNEADTPSLCIQLIHLIKVVSVWLTPRSGAVDLYLLLKNTPFCYHVNELTP